MAYPLSGGGGGSPGPGNCASEPACPILDAYSNPEWDGNPVGDNTSGPYGLQPSTTGKPDAGPIGVLTSVPGVQTAARAVDTIPRLAPIVEAFRARPDSIFANGFQ
jgi:peptidyl-Asp metalloendopeptidase